MVELNKNREGIVRFGKMEVIMNFERSSFSMVIGIIGVV